MNIKQVDERSFEEVLEYCIDEMMYDELSLLECLDRFPQHRTELDPLLQNYTSIRSMPRIAPSQEFIKHGYWQLIEHLGRKYSTLQRQQRKTTPKVRRRRFVMVPLTVVVAMILAAVTSGTVYASDGAEPGDSLYGVDLAVEQVRIGLAADDETAAKLHLEFAAERIEEAEGRLAEDDYENAEIAIDGYSAQMASAAQLVSGSEGSDQAILTAMVENAWEIHTEVLTQLLDEVPEQAQAGFQTAIHASSVSPVGPPEDTSKPEDTGKPEDSTIDDPQVSASAVPWVTHVRNSWGIVRTMSDNIPDDVTVTVEEDTDTLQDSNGIRALSPLVTVYITNNDGVPEILDPPGTEICIIAGDTSAIEALASWTPGPNGGIYSLVSTYSRGGYLCTTTTRTGTFGLVDQIDFL